MSGDTLVFIIMFFVAFFYWIGKRREKRQEKRRFEKYNDYLNDWLANTEPKHRNDMSNKGYPKDWDERRQYILNKGTTCEQCGKEFQPRFIFAGWFVKGVHVHHVQPISLGGNHSLDNLVLLCENCHAHRAGHQHVHRDMNIRNYKKSMTYVHDARVKKGRKNYTCSICERSILSGEKYYGGRYGGKLCVNCHPNQM